MLLNYFTLLLLYCFSLLRFYFFKSFTLFTSCIFGLFLFLLLVFCSWFFFFFEKKDVDATNSLASGTEKGHQVHQMVVSSAVELMFVFFD